MVKSVQNIFAFVHKLRDSSTNDTVPAVLSFMDRSLLANIMLIVSPAGREDFVDPLIRVRSEDQPVWIALGFSAIKPNLIGTLAAIAASRCWRAPRLSTSSRRPR
jgi:uncharacterized membrane protein YqhA